MAAKKSNQLQNNMLVVLGAGLIFGFILGHLYTKVNILEKGGVATGGTVQNTGDAAAPAGDEQPREITIEAPDPTEDHWDGPEDARYIHVEYSDFECPFCQRYFTDTYPQIKEEYGDEMAFVYRHFPLSFHPLARPAAIASECVAELGGETAFWQMHDLIFEAMPDIEVSGFADLAVESGVDSVAFQTCLDEERYGDKVDAQFTEGSTAGVAATPTAVIYDMETGESTVIEGALPFASAQQIIDDFMNR